MLALPSTAPVHVSAELVTSPVPFQTIAVTGSRSVSRSEPYALPTASTPKRIGVPADITAVGAAVVTPSGSTGRADTVTLTGAAGVVVGRTSTWCSALMLATPLLQLPVGAVALAEGVAVSPVKTYPAQAISPSLANEPV